MTTAARSRFLALLKDGETELMRDFALFADRARSILLDAADSDGKIPVSAWDRLKELVGVALLRYFLADDGHAYTVANGVLLPRSPYMRLLWTQVTTGTQQGVDGQASALRALLYDTPTLERQFQVASLSPFDTGVLAQVDLGEVETLFAHYAPQWNVLWNDNRTLNDRVLMTAAETRRKVTVLLGLLLSEGKDARTISNTLRDFMTKGLKTPTAPYGTRAGYDASRLLASETNFAYQRALYMSAALNPFVESVDIVLSPTHTVVDQCDAAAAGSPYLLKDAPVLGIHASCLCGYRFHYTRGVAAVTEKLRGSDVTKVKGALSPGFADLLLRGGAL